MPSLARILVLSGLFLVLAGAIVAAVGRLHIPFGRLPGDISFRGRNWSVYFPLATSVIVSVLLSLLLWLVGRFWR
jgi:Protein of unknown function (DUF2905)